MRKRINSVVKNRYTQTVRNIMNDLSRPVEVLKKPTKHECFINVGVFNTLQRELELDN